MQPDERQEPESEEHPKRSERPQNVDPLRKAINEQNAKAQFLEMVARAKATTRAEKGPQEG